MRCHHLHLQPPMRTIHVSKMAGITTKPVLHIVGGGASAAVRRTLPFTTASRSGVDIAKGKYGEDTRSSDLCAARLRRARHHHQPIHMRLKPSARGEVYGVHFLLGRWPVDPAWYHVLHRRTTGRMRTSLRNDKRNLDDFCETC